MPFDFEALVGHLYVVGGRSISAMPPGTLVEVAPAKAARGRETDTFFVLVSPAGTAIAPAAFYEQMARASAERYFNSTGSVTTGLRSVFNSLNEDLYNHNNSSEKRYEVNLVCAVLRGSDLYLGRVGSGVALFHKDAEAQPFPVDFTQRELLAGTPLGAQAMPDVKMGHYQVANGTRLILADSHLAELPFAQTAEALRGADIAEVLVSLKDLLLTQGSLIAAEFVPPEAPVDLPVHESESTLALQVGAKAEMSDASESAPDARRRRSKAPGPLEAPVRSSLSKIALALAALGRVVSFVLDRLLPQPKEGQRSLLATPVATGATVLIPVLVVVLVLFLWLSGTGESEFEQCVDEAMTAASVARGISSADVQGTLAAWNAVLTVVDRCNEIRSGDVALAALKVEGRHVLDQLLQIDRRVLTQVASFPNAGLRRVVLQGEDMYVLDDQNDLVYRIKITEDGKHMVPQSMQAIPSMRKSASVEEFEVVDILDITWAQDGTGLSQGNVLIALARLRDRNGNEVGGLVECPPRFLESLSCEAQQLLNTELWVEPKAIYMWQGRLYVLDPGANQIWRYDPGSGAFTNVPTEYFVGAGRPDIRNAIDFGINEAGQVFMLLNNGTVAKFQSGQVQPFAYATFPDGQQINRADAMFLNTNPIAQGLLIVDRESRTIYETTLAGTFMASYRPQDESMFTTLADAAVDGSQKVIYAVSGNTVFALDRDR